MKIFHIVNGNDVGGAMTQVLALVKAQAKLHEVHLVSVGNGPIVDSCSALGINTYVHAFSFSGIWSLVNYIKTFKNQDTIVHLHGLKPMFAGALASLTTQLNTVATIHSDFYLEYKNKWFKQFLAVNMIKWSIKRIKRFITVSDKFLNLLYGVGVDMERATFIPNGIDLSLVHPSESRKAFLDQYKIQSEGKIICGIAARLHPVKGVDLLIDVAKHIDNQDVIFMIAGIGEKHYVANLKDKVIQAGLSDKIKFIGYVKAIYNFYNAIDINLLTSYAEGVSYAVMEGGALAKPVVSTDVSGMKTLVENGEDGLIVPIGDAQAFARALSTLADNEEMRLRLGEHLQKKVVSSFTNDVMVSRYDKVYLTFLKGE